MPVEDIQRATDNRTAWVRNNIANLSTIRRRLKSYSIPFVYNSQFDRRILVKFGKEHEKHTTLYMYMYI